MKHGIESVQKIVKLGVLLGNTAGVVLEDSKVNFSDIGSLLSLGEAAQLLVEIDFSKALPELGDLDAAELEALKASFAKLELPNDVLEQKLEKLFAGVAKMYLGFQEIVSVFKPV